MRIGINVSFLARPMTGSGQYTAGLLGGLARLGGPHSYVMLDEVPNPFALAKLALPDTPGSSYVAPVRPPLGRREDLRKLFFEQVGLPRAAARQGCDLLHYPYFAAPLLSRVPVVSTVHDVIPIVLPGYRGSPAARLYTRLVSAGAQRARLILTDSEASRQDIVTALGIPEARIRVIPLAAADVYRPADEAERARTRERYGLPERYLYYVGGFDARKNVDRLIDAWESLGDLPHVLAIAGDALRTGPLFTPVWAMVKERGLQRRVLFVGPVPLEENAALLAAASGFVYPSLYEGFGLPPLEAMACGTPVACSDASSLPEVVGDAAIAFDPHDTGAIATAVRRLLTDETARPGLVARGLARAAGLSWERTAAATLRAYQEALG